MNGGEVGEVGEGIMSIPGAEDTIDQSTFEQIVEMDEDEAEREFSKSIVYDFFTQAEGTFVNMDTNLCVASLLHLHLHLSLHEHTAD